MTRYEVTGPVAVFGHAPGARFEKDNLSAGAEQALVEAGALIVVDWPDVTPVYPPVRENNDQDDDGA